MEGEECWRRSFVEKLEGESRSCTRGSGPKIELGRGSMIVAYLKLKMVRDD